MTIILWKSVFPGYFFVSQGLAPGITAENFCRTCEPSNAIVIHDERRNGSRIATGNRDSRYLLATDSDKLTVPICEPNIPLFIGITERQLRSRPDGAQYRTRITGTQSRYGAETLKPNRSIRSGMDTQDPFCHLFDRWFPCDEGDIASLKEPAETGKPKVAVSINRG
jgi:hypothetical protein